MGLVDTRIGFVIPHSDVTSEPTLAQILPSSVSFHISRMQRAGKVVEKDLTSMTGRALDRALELLPLPMLDLIVYHCTSGSIVSGPQRIQEHIEKATNLPAITTAHAVVDALSHLNSGKVFLVTPYVQTINQLEAEFLHSKGFTVTATSGREIEDGYRIQEVTPAEIVSWVVAQDTFGADTVFISCTGLPSLEINEKLEKQIQLPVITSTGATIWLALKRLGITSEIYGHGCLLARRARLESD